MERGLDPAVTMAMIMECKMTWQSSDPPAPRAGPLIMPFPALEITLALQREADRCESPTRGQAGPSQIHRLGGGVGKLAMHGTNSGLGMWFLADLYFLASRLAPEKWAEAVSLVFRRAFPNFRHNAARSR